MLACFRMGAVALPCNPQLRAQGPGASDRRRRTRRSASARSATSASCRTASPTSTWRTSSGSSTRTCPRRPPAEAVDLDPEDPAVIIFTSGTTGDPRGVVYPQRYLTGQRLQAEHWVGAREGELAWCTAAPGWSKSTRNVFIAPGSTGAAALIHDGRFDPAERLELIEREGVNVLCQAPTEYRMLAKRAELRPIAIAAAAGLGRRAAQPRGDPRSSASESGCPIGDGYGQTETGAGHRDAPRRGRSGQGRLDGPAAARDRGAVAAGASEDGELAGAGRRDRSRPSSAATSARSRSTASGGRPATRCAGTRTATSGSRAATTTSSSPPATGSAPSRSSRRWSPIRPSPRRRRWRRPTRSAARWCGRSSSCARASPPTRSPTELQEHVKAVTAPYKYPRIVEFAEELPKTPSGKIKRAELRAPMKPPCPGSWASFAGHLHRHQPRPARGRRDPAGAAALRQGRAQRLRPRGRDRHRRLRPHRHRLPADRRQPRRPPRPAGRP